MKIFNNYGIAIQYSTYHPYEQVKFCDLSYRNSVELMRGLNNGKYIRYYHSGECQDIHFFVDDVRHGEYTLFCKNGEISKQLFYKNDALHGEYIDKNKINDHHFFINGVQMDDLDYLINADRDEAFYVTLALHGIDKEHTIQE